MSDLLRVSGVRKASYTNAKRVFEKLLNINKVLGVNEMCIQTGVSEVRSEAEKILKKYQEATHSDASDLQHPQYAAMSVYMACKKQKVKVSKQILVPLSRLKPAQWTMLEKAFEKALGIQNAPTTTATIETGAKPKVRAKENVMPMDFEDDSESKKKLSGSKKGPQEESYEDWRARILQKAYADLERMKKQGIECPL